MTKFRTALLAATVLALPLAAQAQPVSGPYVAAGAGVNWLMDQNHSASTEWFDLKHYSHTHGYGRVNGKWKAESRLGFVGLGSVGWGFGNGLRAEVEGSWRSNTYHGDSFSGSVDWTEEGRLPISGSEGGGHVRGRTDQYAVMVNALFDMNIGQSWIYPYVGAGVGYSWQRFVGHRAGGGGYLLPDGDHGGLGYKANDTVGRFAYQAIAGAAFPIASVPGLSFTAEYRFFGTAGSQNYDAHGGGHADIEKYPSDLEGSGKIRRARVDEAYNHSILLGLRYAFNAAPAAVVAAPAPVVPAGKSFLVFFDWDRSTLTARARQVIKEAADHSKMTKHTQVAVNGYADTSGNPKYNMDLSMRRAQTVAAELVRLGVPKQEIAIKAFGDTVLLVPTGPGVREPQNRRVEIIIK